MCTIFYVAEGFLLEKAIDEQVFNLFELCIKTFDFLIVIFFNRVYFFSHVAQFSNLFFNFVLELWCQFTHVVDI